MLAAGHRIAGFLVGSLTGDLPMMEVRPELRRYGLGQQLVEHYLDCIQKAGGLGARVECHPPSSAPFWKQLGFRPYFDRRPLTTEEEGSFTHTAQRLARILSGKSEVPEEAPHVAVTLAFVEPANLVPIAPPFTTEAARVGAEWCFVKSFCEYFQSVDSYLCLTISGKQVWFDKAKRIDEVGGEREGGMIRLCRVTVPTNIDV